jgi:DNA-binding beta-propeller fold protein YncE
MGAKIKVELFTRPLAAVSILCAIAFCLLFGGANAQTPEGLTGTVIVLNKGSATASFIDLALGRVVASAPTGDGPHELVVSSDGRTAVGTDYGRRSDGSSLTVFDVPSATRVRTIDMERFTRPHGIDFLPGDALVAVTSERAGAVVFVRVADGQITETIPTQARGSHMLAVTADGETIWTGDMRSNTVTELSLRRTEKVRSFVVPDVPEAVNISPDGSRVFAGSNTTGRVTAWNTTTGDATTVGVGFGWPYRIFLTPGMDQILVPDFRNEVLRFFDGDNYTESGHIAFPGEGPQGLTLHPDGQHLFLSLSSGNRIAIVDVLARQVVGYLPTDGVGPDGIGYSQLRVTAVTGSQEE